jgi:Uma2 family endonuclease
LLAPHVIREGLGKVLMPTGFRLQTNPDTVREPDVAFISRQRLPSSAAGSRGFLQSAPDLAVEVISPTDRQAAVRAKVVQYLESGVRMVWTVDPRRETVTVHRPSGEPVTLRDGDVLDGGDVVPGFSCDIRRIFH